VLRASLLSTAFVTALLAGCAGGSHDASPSSSHLLTDTQVAKLTCADWSGLAPADKIANAEALNNHAIHIWNLGVDSGPSSGLPHATPVTLSVTQRQAVVAAADNLCATDDRHNYLVAGSLAGEQEGAQTPLPGWPRS